MSLIAQLYDRVRYLLRYRRNPAVYVALALVVVLTGWRMANGMPLDVVLTEHHVESMLILAGGVITRLQVWSPETVEDLFAARDAVEEHAAAAEMPVIELAATVGIPSSIGSYGRPRSGIVVHYVGASHVSRGSHANCRTQVRSWHRYHKNGNGWAGLGYHYCVCHHGIVMTGRGLTRVGAHAPGANSSHVGVLIMLGGSQKPTKSQLKGFREFRTWLGKRGVRTGNVSPHSRWTSTSCPGSHLRGRVANNNWGTGGSVGASEEDPLIGLSKGDKGEAVKGLQALITYAGGSLPKYGVDGDYGAETAEGLRQVRESVGSEAGKGWGDQVTGYGYAQFMKAVTRHQD